MTRRDGPGTSRQTPCCACATERFSFCAFLGYCSPEALDFRAHCQEAPPLGSLLTEYAFVQVMCVVLSASLVFGRVGYMRDEWRTTCHWGDQPAALGHDKAPSRLIVRAATRFVLSLGLAASLVVVTPVGGSQPLAPAWYQRVITARAEAATKAAATRAAAIRAAAIRAAAMAEEGRRVPAPRDRERHGRHSRYDELHPYLRLRAHHASLPDGTATTFTGLTVNVSQ